MSGTSGAIRLDQALTERGLAPSRSRARDMVLRRCVRLDGAVALQPAARVWPESQIEIDDPAAGYVSRAALKLVAALDVADIDVRGSEALDLGASTGGFTQVLLQRGAARVTAVDVGHGQFHDSLRGDGRIVLCEGLNARHLTLDELPAPPEVIVSDVSFISLKLAAEPALRLAAPGARAALLVKPQFEVGPDAVGKGGIVRDTAVAEAAFDGIVAWFDALPGWRHTHRLPSPIAGGDGNHEFLLCGART